MESLNVTRFKVLCSSRLRMIPPDEGIERKSLDEKSTGYSDGIGLNDNSIRGLCPI